MSTFKRFVAILMTAAMLVSMLSVPAFAEEVPVELVAEPVIETVAEEPVVVEETTEEPVIEETVEEPVVVEETTEEIVFDENVDVTTEEPVAEEEEIEYELLEELADEEVVEEEPVVEETVVEETVEEPVVEEDPAEITQWDGTNPKPDNFPTDPLTFEDLGLAMPSLGKATASYMNPQTIVLSSGSSYNVIVENNDGYVYPFTTSFTLDADYMPQSAVWLAIRCFDVNESDSWLSHFEYDQVFVNGHMVGILTGQGGEWNTTCLYVPVEYLKAGTNNITVYVGMKFTEDAVVEGVQYEKGDIFRDCLYDPDIPPRGYWLMMIDQIQVLCDGGDAEGKPDYFDVQIDDAYFSGSYLYCEATTTIQSSTSQTYELEYALTDNTSGNSDTFGQIIASSFKTISGTNVTNNAVLSIPKSSPSGEYLLSVFLRDSDDVILATDEYAFDYVTDVLPSFDIKNLTATLSNYEYTKSSITMTVTANVDPDAGISNIYCYLNGVSKGLMSMDSSGNLKKTLTISQNDDYLVELNFTKDGEQHSAKTYVTVENIDKTAPWITFTDNGDGTVKVTYGDSLSGISSAKYTLNNSSTAPSSYSSSMPSSGFKANMTSNRYFHYSLTDKAGNVRKATFTSNVPALTSASVSKSSEYANTSVTFTVKTSTDAAYVTMYSESGAKVKTWPASGNSTVSGTVRTWTLPYAFSNAGNRTMTFKASIDGTNYCVGKSVAVKVLALPTLTSATVNAATVVAGENAIFIVRTSSDAKYVAMFGENGAKVTSWDAATYSAVDGSERVWSLPYAFSNAGNRTMTFKASPNNTGFSAGKSVKLTVKPATTVNSAKVSKSPVAQYSNATFIINTSSNAKYVKMYGENGAVVKTWAASGYSTVSGSERVWSLPYAFSNSGTRSMTFKASIDGSAMSEGKKVTLVVKPVPTISSVTANKTSTYVKSNVTYTVLTSKDATHLRMYAESGSLVKTWAASGNSTVSGTQRRWVVTYAFSNGGTRTMTFKASFDGTYYGQGKTAKVTVNALPAVTSASSSLKELTAKNTLTLTVKAPSAGTYLGLYAENGVLVKTWSASGNSTVANGVRTWSVKYTFQGAGNRTITLKVSPDGTNFGVGKSVTVNVLPLPSIQMALFAEETVKRNEAMEIVVMSSTNAYFLHMYREDGVLVKTWKAADSSTVSGGLRVWTVSYAFAGDGERTMTFKTSADNKNVGAGKKATITVTVK